MKRLHAAIERHTGTVFGIMKTTSRTGFIPRGTIYVRFGSGDDDLVLFECGTRNAFLYFDVIGRR